MKPRILIVEDEPGIADTLQYALRTEGFEPAWVATGEAALADAAATPPALVILDVGLPDASGFEIFRRLRATSEVPVVFLTARSDEIDRVVGLELGADDYVAKPFSPRELVARVRGVLRRAAPAAAFGSASASGSASGPGSGPAGAAGAAGGSSSSSSSASSSAPASTPPIAVDEGRMQIRYYGRLLELSRYEFGLLRTLAARPGHVYSRDALLERVWGNDSDSMDRTVDAHVKTLRAKMRAIAPLLDPIRTLRGSGYALAEDLPARTPDRLETDMRLAHARRALLTAALFLPVAAMAQATRPDEAAPRTYAVVSLIGDQFSVVSRRHSVGTNLDPNERRVFAMPDPVFDRIAGLAVERALLAAKPATPVLQAAIRDPRLFALQDKLYTESAESHDMRIALRDLLVKAGATHLLLVTKWRGEAMFPVTTGMIGGGGPISGLGFYLDNETTMTNVEKPNTGVGFLAPFSYVMVAQIELASMRVVKAKHAPQSLLWLPVDKEGADRSWDALSPKEKVDALEMLVRRSAQAGTEAVIAP